MASNKNNKNNFSKISKLAKTLKISPPILFLLYLIAYIAEFNIPGFNNVFKSSFFLISIFFISFCMLLIEIVKKIVPKHTINDIKNDFDKIFAYWIRGKLYPKFSSINFIQWVTKGRFAVKIECRETINMRIRNFNSDKCKRVTCHFGPNNNSNTLPRLYAKTLPRRARKKRHVRIAPHEFAKTNKRFSCPGELIGWTSQGITYEINKSEWDSVVLSCSAHLPKIYLFLHIGWWVIPIYARISIKPKEVKRDGKISRIFGEFTEQFQPDLINRNLKRWLSIPVCYAWEAQGTKPPFCNYDNNAPKRLKVL